MLSNLQSSLLKRSLFSRTHTLHNGKGRPDLRQFSSYSSATRHLVSLPRRSAIPCRAITPLVSARFLSFTSKSTYDPLLDKNAQSPSTQLPLPEENTQSPSTQAALDQSTIKSDFVSENAWDPNFIDPSSVHETITPHIGYLREMGLDYGWGPTSVLQYVIEHIQVYSGLPWYAVIPLAAIVVRVCILPLSLRGAVHSSKLAAARPLLESAKTKMRAAKESGDQSLLLQAVKEVQAIKKNAGIKQTAVFLPILLQMPLAFGAFKLLRAMADVPVDGLKTGGILWFTDLTMHDPYYILPLATSAVMYYTMKLGTEYGTHPPETKRVMQIVPKFLAPVSFIFTSFFPAALVLHFLTASVLAYCQTRLMQNPIVRKAIGSETTVQAPVQEVESSRPRFVDTTVNEETNSESGRLAKMLDFKRQKESMRSAGGDMWKAMEKNLPSMQKSVTDRVAKRAQDKAERYETMRREEIEDEKQRQRELAKSSKRNKRKRS